MVTPGVLNEHLTVSLCSNHEFCPRSPHREESALSPIPALSHTAFSSSSCSLKKGLYTIQIMASPELGHLHLLLRKNTPFQTGFFCYGPQIKPSQMLFTGEDSPPGRAVSFLYKQESLFPSHSKDFSGIAANPCLLGI